jgi:hypothetical protein
LNSLKPARKMVMGQTGGPTAVINLSSVGHKAARMADDHIDAAVTTSPNPSSIASHRRSANCRKWTGCSEHQHEERHR